MTPSGSPAAISTEEAVGRAWDVIVVGAGPAGAVAARQLASLGAATLLVERHCWPRQKVCGGCLGPRAIGMLRAIGLERVLSDSLATPLTRLHLRAGRWKACLSLPGGLAIERSRFDAELVRAAVEAGARFMSATQATVEPDTECRAANCRRVLLAPAGRQSALTTARLVIAADGLGNPSLKRLPQFASRVEGRARIGISMAIDCMPESYREGAVFMAVSQAGYVGMVRTTGGRGNLAAAIDTAALREAKDPASAAAAILADAGFELPDFSAIEPWRGTLPLTRRANQLACNRIFVLGDAAGYVEPFTGEGIGWAMASAAGAVPWMVRNLDHWDARSACRWELAQQRQIERGQTVCRLIARLLRKPIAVRMAIAALAIAPVLARPIVRHVCRPLAAAELDFV